MAKLSTLYIAIVWTIVATTQRIKQSQQVAGVQDQQDGIVPALLWIFTLGLGATVYMQYQLNRSATAVPAAAAPSSWRRDRSLTGDPSVRSAP